MLEVAFCMFLGFALGGVYGVVQYNHFLSPALAGVFLGFVVWLIAKYFDDDALLGFFDDDHK